MPTGAMAAMAAAAQLLRGLAEAADIPFMLSASSVDESASEQGDSSADEPLLQSEEEIASEQGDSSDADRVGPRPERGHVAGEVSHCILASSLHCWRLVCVITQKFRRSIVRPEHENLAYVSTRTTIDTQIVCNHTFPQLCQGYRHGMGFHLLHHRANGIGDLFLFAGHSFEYLVLVLLHVPLDMN